MNSITHKLCRMRPCGWHHREYPLDEIVKIPLGNSPLPSIEHGPLPDVWLFFSRSVFQSSVTTGYCYGSVSSSRYGQKTDSQQLQRSTRRTEVLSPFILTNLRLKLPAGKLGDIRHFRLLETVPGSLPELVGRV